MTKKVYPAVVIPIYKMQLSREELASLHQCIEVFKNHPIFFVAPPNLKYPDFASTGIKTIYFDSKYFSGIKGYNSLMLSPKFYKKFKQFSHILIYQLDAWVFRDDLHWWCSQEYDYIGAPWFEGYDQASSHSAFLGVGNGGFSLRKVSSHLRVLNTFSYIESPRKSLKNFFTYSSKATLRNLVSNSITGNNTFHLLNDFAENEDGFWSQIASRFEWFKIPDFETAKKFSLEVNASSFIKSEQDLPFGCHAWERYDRAFWEHYIKF